MQCNAKTCTKIPTKCLDFIYGTLRYFFSNLSYPEHSSSTFTESWSTDSSDSDESGSDSDSEYLPTNEELRWESAESGQVECIKKFGRVCHRHSPLVNKFLTFHSFAMTRKAKFFADVTKMARILDIFTNFGAFSFTE
jgi:hypothetical protein